MAISSGAIRSASVIGLRIRHGFPTARTPGGNERVTTLPAPITVPSPMVTPGRTVTFEASHTLQPIVTGCAAMIPSLRWAASRAWVIVAMVQFGPMNTLCPIRTGASSRIVRLKLPIKLSPIWILKPKSHRNGLLMTVFTPMLPINDLNRAIRSSDIDGRRAFSS